MAGIPTFPPRRESQLLTWSSNWSAKITAMPLTYGLTAAQAAAYAALHAAWTAAYNAAVNPNSNSKQAIIAKNQMKEMLLNGPGGAWELVDIVQAFPGTTDAMRGELGLRIPDAAPTPVPDPATAPDLSIIATMGRLVRVRLRDQANPDRRGKPAGVQGATVLFFAGETAPADPALWVFAANTSRTLLDVEIPAGVAAGTRVWLTAFWFNARKAASPAAAPESTRISDGLAAAA
jgi:hypothetical protein